ncbi:hypothetical protein, partial [Xenorhabdus littoralis]|uniref:hypothetical protein n=1 Tax=Xenorhabdus littoralis TaxID=2582835 RepID=UPI0029E81C61
HSGYLGLYHTYTQHFKCNYHLHGFYAIVKAVISLVSFDALLLHRIQVNDPRFLSPNSPFGDF